MFYHVIFGQWNDTEKQIASNGYITNTESFSVAWLLQEEYQLIVQMKFSLV